MYTLKQQRAMEYVSNLKDGTYKVWRSSELLWIELSQWQDIYIFQDGVVEGVSHHFDWTTIEMLNEYVQCLYILKNLLYYIEHGHNEVTT